MEETEFISKLLSVARNMEYQLQIVLDYWSEMHPNSPGKTIWRKSTERCLADLQALISGVSSVSKGVSQVNEQYLNLVLQRQDAAETELAKLLGAADINTTIGREVILNALSDIPALVEEIQRLREESRQASLAELAQRPWEKGSETVVVNALLGGIVLSSQLQPELIKDPSNGEKCGECGGGFTPEEWYARHTADDGSDLHQRCCPRCKALNRKR